jgi:predicted CXXCH cytochrome family protein
VPFGAIKIAVGLCLAFFALQTTLAQGDLGFVGTDTCVTCHKEQFAAWKNSHHDLAMQEATAETVLGDFDDATFAYHGSITQFSKDANGFWVTTEGPDGVPKRFSVRYVFGVYPLQQYLLPLEGGRLQALTIAWDSRPTEEGGQRWYHLYPDENIKSDDRLHWTGPYHNWNARCAECHSTNVRKNFDALTNTYSTQFNAINVGCEACHGPGENHLKAVRQGNLSTVEKGGFEVSLQGNRTFQRAPEDDTASSSHPAGSLQIENCGRCHSRRRTLGEYHYGRSLTDTHLLAMLSPPLYHPDGQIRDEVYVYGSFIQSKMYAAGVVCTNCHEPHSNQLVAKDNALCTQCHNADSFDTPVHHRHATGTSGSECVNCHMPEQTYMGVDQRRDHSMRVPRPDLSETLGTPNACTQCHLDRSDAWAAKAVEEWGIDKQRVESTVGELFFDARLGAPDAFAGLETLAMNPNANGIWRGTAIEELGRQGVVGLEPLIARLVQSSDSIIRASAVRASEALPLVQRYQVLRPILGDKNRSVVTELATALAAVPLDQIDSGDASALENIFRAYLEIQLDDLDLPSVQARLGNFYLRRGDISLAEASYRAALEIDPETLGAHINLADLKRTQGDEQGARVVLLGALDLLPSEASLLYALGLLEVRGGNYGTALGYLKEAAHLEEGGLQYRYVYSVALHDMGRIDEAIEELKAALEYSKYSSDVLYALAAYSFEIARYADARAYAKQLVSLYPGNETYRQLDRQISNLSQD